MIHRVFELEDALFHAVMVPRPDMFCLDVATEPVTPAAPVGASSCLAGGGPEDTVDQIQWGCSTPRSLVPISTGCRAAAPASALLWCQSPSGPTRCCTSCHAKEAPSRPVVDEYGGTAQLVTLTILLEELVGEIPQQAYDEDERLVPTVTPRTFRARAGSRSTSKHSHPAPGLQRGLRHRRRLGARSLQQRPPQGQEEGDGRGPGGGGEGGEDPGARGPGDAARAWHRGARPRDLPLDHRTGPCW